MKIKNATHAGFTLIEILIVIAILAVICTFTIPVSMNSFHGYSFDDERNNIVSTLQKARSQSQASVCLGMTCTDSMPHGVHFQSGHYILFQGAVYNPADSTNETETENPMIVTTGFSDVIFDQISGDASTTPNGVSTLTVSDAVSHTSVISINPEGQITWTN